MTSVIPTRHHTPSDRISIRGYLPRGADFDRSRSGIATLQKVCRKSVTGAGSLDSTNKWARAAVTAEPVAPESKFRCAAQIIRARSCLATSSFRCSDHKEIRT